MPTAQQLQAIRALMPGKFKATSDPYLSRRTEEITSGIDDMVSDADSAELREAQGKVGGGFSRDAIRTSAMGDLRQRLKLDAAKQAYELDKENAKGAWGVREQEAAGRAAGDRLRYTQDSQNARSEANQAAIMARLDKTIGAQGARQEDQQTFKAEQKASGPAPSAVPLGMYDAVTKAEQALPRNPVTKMLFGKGANATYESALTNYLDRKGELSDAQAVAQSLTKYQGSLEDRIAAAQADPAFKYDLSGLDPYTRKYLGLKIGQ